MYPIHVTSLMYVSCALCKTKRLWFSAWQKDTAHLMPSPLKMYRQKGTENHFKWKNNNWIELKTWCQKEKLLVLSNFFLCRHVFKEPSAAEASESVYMRERVNTLTESSNKPCRYQQHVKSGDLHKTQRGPFLIHCPMYHKCN